MITKVFPSPPTASDYDEKDQKQKRQQAAAVRGIVKGLDFPQ